MSLEKSSIGDAVTCTARTKQTRAPRKKRNGDTVGRLHERSSGTRTERLIRARYFDSTSSDSTVVAFRTRRRQCLYNFSRARDHVLACNVHSPCVDVAMRFTGMVSVNGTVRRSPTRLASTEEDVAGRIPTSSGLL
jgi:hypothetical protein